MNGLIEVIHAGLGNSIQDAGRFGYRHMGIAVSGWLDALLARCANVLSGSAEDAACIEMRVIGPSLQVREGPLCLAVVGHVTPRVRRVDGRMEEVPAWRSITLAAGDVVETGTVRGGVAYLAVSGGIEIPLQLGSRSTYTRARIGGIDGNLLKNGDLLRCEARTGGQQNERQAAPWRHSEGPVRVMLGPQEGNFKPESVQDFLRGDYRVTPQMDRMGMRLEGKPLEHRTPEAADIVSDGVTSGSIQVPGSGQPIILLADCQTIGGYPKIGTVISADLPRLAQMKPGDTIRFAAVDAALAREALVRQQARWQDWVASVGIVPALAADDRGADDVDWVAV